MTDLDRQLAEVRQATGKRFWRALDELVDTPAFRTALAERFPALAGPGDWRRRDILKCLGGALAIAGLDGCERLPDEDALPFVEQQEGETPGIARYYASAVEMEGIAQPIIGKTREGRPIKLEGNPNHPASGGATDAFTQAALLNLYDPDRSAAPQSRGAPATWAEADRMLAGLRIRLDASGGAGFRLLTGPSRSPTLTRQIAALLARWPGARWHRWSPMASLRAPDLAETAPVSLDRAQAVVCFDADPLGPGPHQTWQAQGWAARRRAFQAGEGGSALFVAEPTPTLTGVTATDRLIARADRMPGLLAALAAALGQGDPAPIAPAERAWLTAAAQALRAAGADGLILVGEQQPAAVHALARSIGAALGHAAAPARQQPGPQPGTIGELTAAMARSEVETLLVLDSNPIYAAPPALRFGALHARVPLRLHAGLHVDETARRSHWHLPLAHALESWSDGEAADGTPTLTQPLVRPWLDVRSRHALLAALLGEAPDGQAPVRATWQLDNPAWAQALVRGMPPARAAVPQPTAVAPAPRPAPPPRTGLALLIRPDPSVWDGSFASNPWLQETPKPLTKVTWGNAVHLSPALAAARGLANGDRVRVAAGGHAVEGPVWIVPGQQHDTILVHLGHGRTAGGRVAQGVGFSAAPLLGLSVDATVTLTRLDGRDPVVSTQAEDRIDDEAPIRSVAAPGARLPAKPPHPNFYPPQRTSPAWGMAIDLDLCIGCNACVVACAAENNVPMVGKNQVANGRQMHWLRVDRYYSGDADTPEHGFQPVPCMHCEDAPCEMGCPVNAAVHSPDGLNLQVYNRCIGTRTCSAYCPYKVRRFNWLDYAAPASAELKAQRNPEVTVRARGIMEKCTYCIQRISAARIAAKKDDRAIADGEVATACQAACPTQAIVFGDVSSPATAVSQRKGDGRDYALLPGANTRPRTTYQARIRKERG